jgi:hypothetical protein
MTRSTRHDNRNSKARGGPRSGDAGSDRGAVLMSISIAGVLSSMAKGLAEQASADKAGGHLAVVASAAQAARDAATCYWYLISTSGTDHAAHLCQGGLRHAETAEHRLERLSAPAPAHQRAAAGEGQWIALHAELDTPYLIQATDQAQELLDAAYPDPARRRAAALALQAARDLLTYALTVTTHSGADPQQLAAGRSHLVNLRSLLRSLGAEPAADWRQRANSAPIAQTGAGE